MTDDVMRDLVTKHDTVITSLVSSVEHLVNSQTETNKRLEEISKFLAKQVVFSTKLENLDKELGDSFKRVHNRVDEIDTLQKSDQGCNSVRLLRKDIEVVQRDNIRLVGNIEDHRRMLEHFTTVEASHISGSTLRWVIGFIILYSVSFGGYVVESFNKLDRLEAKVMVQLERDMVDTKWLMKIHREEQRNK